MPRRRLERSSEYPYHVSARSNNKEWFHAPLEMVWDVFCRELTFVSTEMDVRIHAFVLMSNHFHLVLTCPREDVGRVMRQFLGSVAKTLNRISGRQNHVFGSRYFGSMIRTEEHFDCVMKYVYRNPAKAGLISRVEEYSFSTLHSMFGLARPQLSISKPLALSADWMNHLPTPDVLDWLNEPFLNEQDELISKSLKRAVFKPPSREWKRWPTARVQAARLHSSTSSLV